MGRRDDTGWFFHEVYGHGADAEHLISVFTTPDRRTRFFADVNGAAQCAQAVAGDQNVYAGVGFFRPGIGHGRGTASDVLAIPGFWADVDFGKEGAPPTPKEALTVIGRVGPPPSFVVHSGHGFQPWWLLSEPLDAGDGAASAARRWGKLVQECAGALGYKVDSVWDLSRVLRVPGTVNRKHDPVPVHILDYPKQIIRHDIHDILAILPDDEGACGDPAQRVQLTLDPHREPPADKLTVLLENDRKFRKLWNHECPDLGDQSPSGYDFQLALVVIPCGWSDEEVAALIAAFRRRHNLDPDKALRSDYVSITIAKARQCRQRDAAIARLSEPTPTSAPDDQGSVDDERPNTLRCLGEIFGVEVAGWIQHGEEDPNYVLRLADGREVAIGPVGNVTSQKRFRDRLYAHVGKVPRRLRSEQWDCVCERLATIAEVIPNEESTRAGKLAAWLDLYLEKNPPLNGDEWGKAVPDNSPFVRDGALHVHADTMRRHLRIDQGIDVRLSEFWEILRASGFEQTKVTAEVNGKKYGRSYWRRPEAYRGKNAGNEKEKT